MRQRGESFVLACPDTARAGHVGMLSCPSFPIVKGPLPLSKGGRSRSSSQDFDQVMVGGPPRSVISSPVALHTFLLISAGPSYKKQSNLAAKQRKEDGYP